MPTSFIDLSCVVFLYRNKRVTWEGKEPMRQRPIMLWEGKRWGDPPPPSLDNPSGNARIEVYKSREATGRHS